MKTKLIILALVGAILVPACGGSGDDSIEGTNVVVNLYDNRYEFADISIPVGGTVTWVGAGRNPHNAVAADESWSTESVFGSLDLLDGDEATLTYNTEGVYVFYCTYHGNADGDGMAGTLTVGGTE